MQEGTFWKKTKPLVGGLDGLLDLFIKNYTCLDIGVAANDLRRYRSPNWKHRKIAEVASDCLGVDIVQQMVDILREGGFKIQLCNATSDRDLVEHIHSLDSLFALPRGILRRIELY